MQHIVLIGFKNAGKTVVGRRLAEELGRKFADLDEEIVKKKGMTPREIIQKEGEVAFRRLESEVLREVVVNTENTILALGGGAVMAKENQKLIQGHTVVLVTGPKEVLFERIMKKGRPAIFEKGLSDREAFEKLYKEREPVYERIANIKVQNEKTVESAVEIILNSPLIKGVPVRGRDV